MENQSGEHGFHCVCDQASTKVDPFLKILDLAHIGFKIYRYLASKYAQVVGVAPQIPGTGADAFILQNTRDKDLSSLNLLQELDANKISCPRCKKVVEHAKRLIETIPSVNKRNIIAVCDHCRKRVKRRYTCEVCEKIVKKFISSVDKRKQQRPFDFRRSMSDFELQNIRSTPERMKYSSFAPNAGYKPKWDSLLEIQKQLEQNLIPCFVKSHHEGGERDELRKQFQKAALIRSRSDTFLNAVSGLTEKILDKSFQYYFPKGARQNLTDKGVTSEEFIRDTQEKYRLITETREKIHEGKRRSALELGKEEYYDQYGQPIRVGKMPEVYYDQHGQLVRRGKTAHVYYDNKYGQPIIGGVMPDIYYDKYGQPVQGRRMPEVYYDEHGQPVPAGPISDGSYDKHGQSIPKRQPPQVYFDEHGQPITESRTPKVFYDKHGQPIPRDRTPQVYYDKHGQPVTEDRTPEVYYDKHGKPIADDRTSDLINEKQRQPLQRRKTPGVYYDKHEQPILVDRMLDVNDKHVQPIKEGNTAEVYYDERRQPATRPKTPEVFYDKHGRPLTRDTLPDVYYDKHGKEKPTPDASNNKLGRIVQRDQVTDVHYDKDGHPTHGEKLPKAYNDDHGRQLQVGGKGRHTSELFYDQHGKPVRGGRKSGHVAKITYDQGGKPVHAEKSKAPSQKGISSSKTPESMKHGLIQPSTEVSSERKKMEEKEKSPKLSKGDKTGRDDQGAIESEKKISYNTKTPKISKTEKEITSNEKSKRVLEHKITQVPSIDEKNIPVEGTKDKKVTEGKDKITQVLSKDEKNVPSEVKKISKLVEGNDKTTQMHLKGEKQSIQEKTKADKRESLPNEKTKDKSKLKDSEAKVRKNVKISGDELDDKDVKRKEAKHADDKQKAENKSEFENKQGEEKPQSEKKKDTKQQKQPPEKKQKSSENVFGDKLKEAKTKKEDKLNQEKASIQKQKEEKENLKLDKSKEKEGKTQKQMENKDAALLKKALDQQAKRKHEEEKQKKANEEQIQKIKDTLNKADPQPLKVSEGTQKPEHTQPFKIDEKLVSKSTKLVKKKSIETPNKELDIKTIQIMRPSNDDLIAKLVTVKPTKKILVPKINEKELQFLGKIHQGHADDGLRDSQCDLCVYSELLFQLDELNEKKLMNEKKEVIIGNEVKKIIAKDFAKVKEEIQGGPVPALYKTIFNIEPATEIYEKKSPEEPVDESLKLKQRPVSTFFTHSIMGHRW